MGSSDLAPPTKAAVTACARAIGPKRRFFGTDQTVQDLDLLRRALGVDKLSLDGVSYGTFVAERYALRYPTHVARLVLDSVVPHVGINGLSVENASAVGRVLRSLCSDAALQGRSGRAARVRRPDVEHRHAAPRRAGHPERLRPDLPGRDRGALRGVPRPARRPRAARRPLRARSEDAGRGAQPGSPRRRALRRQPACPGAGPPRRRATVSPRCSTPPFASSLRRSGRSRARSRPPTGSSARASTGRPSLRLRFRAENCRRCRRCCSPATATCRRRSPGRGRSSRSPPAAR